MDIAEIRAHILKLHPEFEGNVVNSEDVLDFISRLMSNVLDKQIECEHVRKINTTVINELEDQTKLKSELLGIEIELREQISHRDSARETITKLKEREKLLEDFIRTWYSANETDDVLHHRAKNLLIGKL